MAIHPGTGLDHGGLPPAPPLNRSGHPVASGPLTLTRFVFYYFFLLHREAFPMRICFFRLGRAGTVKVIRSRFYKTPTIFASVAIRTSGPEPFNGMHLTSPMSEQI